MTSLRECACAGGNGMLRNGHGGGHSDVGMMGTCGRCQDKGGERCGEERSVDCAGRQIIAIIIIYETLCGATRRKNKKRPRRAFVLESSESPR